jgi:hypothetical protein
LACTSAKTTTRPAIPGLSRTGKRQKNQKKREHEDDEEEAETAAKETATGWNVAAPPLVGGEGRGEGGVPQGQNCRNDGTFADLDSQKMRRRSARRQPAAGPPHPNPLPRRGERESARPNFFTSAKAGKSSNPQALRSTGPPLLRG